MTTEDDTIEIPEEHFGRALGDICDSYLALRPPTKVRVSEGAGRVLKIARPGDAARFWNAGETPYMVEPMDVLASRKHEGLVFVGPAQSGKTLGLGEGWMAHAVVHDPGDMLMVQMTEAKAREFSKQRIDRAIRNSDALRDLLSSKARDDNTHDKLFKHGMWLRIAWPTVTNLSSTSYRYVFITDLDRMPDNIDGEGDPFTLGLKRTTTFMSRGMCAVESSPGRPVTDPTWKPRTAHEAPPVTGILGLYNGTDRRRWYWACPDCSEWFEAAPGVGLFHLPPDEQLLEEVRSGDLLTMARHFARVVCPHCGSMIEFKHRRELNQRGRWLADGARLTAEGELVGSPITASRAGFWLGGVAAEFQSWEGLLNKHLIGLRDYALTGSEIALQAAINTDQAMPYTPRHLVEAASNLRPPQERAERDMQRHVVPDWTRCVLASVDVQGGTTSRFVCEVHAVGAFGEEQLVDRFEIRESKREGMGAEHAPLDPARYPEDWDLITERLLLATWRTPTDGLEIRAKRVVVDSGGEDGVTQNAYAWWRRVRKLGMGARVRLYKGASTPNAPVLKEVLVGKIDAKNTGDVPLLHCNSNLLADAVDAKLKRQTPGPGYMHFPEPKHPTLNPNGWLSQAYFDELASEVRNEKGVWQQIKKRNESWDLCKMIYAAYLSLKMDKITDWSADKVPEWLRPLDRNSEVMSAEDRREMKDNQVISPMTVAPYSAPRAAPQRRVRRSIASPYMR